MVRAKVVVEVEVEVGEEEEGKERQERRAGVRTSRARAPSFSTSARNRYRLHSGSMACPNRCAKRIVASRPVDSWSTVRSTAAVAVEVESPTPKPGERVSWGLAVVLFVLD